MEKGHFMPMLCDETLIEEAARLAGSWQDRANQLLTAREKAYQKQMQRLLAHPVDKAALTRIIDQSFRSQNTGRVADQLNDLLKRHGIPEFFNTPDRLLMHLFLCAGRFLPALAIPGMIEKMRKESRRMIIPGEPATLLAHLEKRRAQGVRVNINHLGEAVLGESKARRRLATYITDLENPAVEHISVKISTIYSQIQPLAFAQTVDVLVDRLSRLFQAAARNTFVRADDTRGPKFVNLDMEEYRDLEITTVAFMRALDQEDFRSHSAGIALQAYLPDSPAIQERITLWAMDRVAAGGAPVKIRLVKGANLEMEKVEAALFNWPLATYDNKRDVDANFKRMVHFGLQQDHIRAVRLGIASHNLFELAYADCLARRQGVADGMIFEMLEGMANHVCRAIAGMSGDVLLYAPVAMADEFINAIAYLVRRLDENTGTENFLRYAPGLTTSDPEWQRLRDQFTQTCRHMPHVPVGSNRIQDRSSERFPREMGTFFDDEFNNEPDTDWSLAANRRWAGTIRDRWRLEDDSDPIPIPIVVDGELLMEQREAREILDPNRQPAATAVAGYHLATQADIDRAAAVARSDPDGWRTLALTERHRMLSGVAMALREARGDLIGAAAADTGKLFTEADVEVSEAIDFAEYYPRSVRAFTGIDTLRAVGKGVGAVVSPWNFPIAIPCGGIAAALATGNTVLFKPSSDAVLTAWVLVQCFWRAGISRRVLQFLPCAGGDVGSHLVTHPEVDFVILTGGTETGLNMLARRPEIFLCAETGGKNSTIVTAMSDRDQAIKNVIYSAFGNSGQKCSATSLLILEREVYDSRDFRRQLVDAAASVRAGSAWDFSNRMGPLIRPPEGDLRRALTTLEPGETWALQPGQTGDNPHLWTPGIKYGVQAGSCTHMIEFFGPLLGVMRADNLEHAIELANMTGYGLTAGLESLDAREQDQWKESIRAGNLYVNRGTTGAITLRQPFGGTGKSALGPAIKAGGPNYVTQFMTFADADLPRAGVLHREHHLLRVVSEWRCKLLWGRLREHAEALTRTIRAVKSYLFHWEQEFGVAKDYFHLRGQDNHHRYRPLGTLMVRVHPDDTLFETLARIAAARITGNRLLVSVPESLDNPVTVFLETIEGRQLLEDTEVRRESDSAVIALLPEIARIRCAAPDRAHPDLLAAAALRGYYIARAPVLMEGRVELLHYLQNQSVCDTYHRYGNLGDRATL
jgi:RHH-type transcriptional regulator, proline utilization regulon repressor / proline dehydrogenase / delta 1-pyrroline-5-carboxylate dehydrogenase